MHGHLREEKHKAIGAAGALKALSTGQRPSPEQMRHLRSVGLRVLMSAGSMAISGDVTGTVPHLAMKLGEEIVNHVIGEHTLQTGASMARLALRRRPIPATVPVYDNGLDLSDEDYALLQAFVEKLAKAAVELDIPDERVQELLGQSNAE